MSDLYEKVEVEVVKVTDKAALLAPSGCRDEAEWVPLACIEDNGEHLEIQVGNTLVLYLFVWKLESLGWI